MPYLLLLFTFPCSSRANYITVHKVITTYLWHLHYIIQQKKETLQRLLKNNVRSFAPEKLQTNILIAGLYEKLCGIGNVYSLLITPVIRMELAHKRLRYRGTSVMINGNHQRLSRVYNLGTRTTHFMLLNNCAWIIIRCMW